MLLLLAGLMSIAFGAPLAVSSSAAATTGSGDEAEVEVLIPSAEEIVPDLVISVAEGPDTEADVDALVRELAASPAIAWAAPDQLSATGAKVVVAFADETGPAGRRAVAAAIADRPDPSGISVAGRDISDRELLDRLGLAVFVAVALAAIAIATFIAWLRGLLAGALSGAIVALAGWLAGTIGGSVTGRFDGSLATTSLPAVLAAVVVAGYLMFRLLVWFAEPHGEDQADMIRRSVLSVGIELSLLFAGLVVVASFLEILDTGRSVATVVLVGAVTAALLTLAIVPAILAALHGSVIAGAMAQGAPNTEGPGPGEPDPVASLLPAAIPTGRDFPTLVLVGFAAFLALLGLFAFRSTGSGEMLDERALGDDSAAVVGTRELLANGGDPTAAIFALFPSGTDQLAKAAWLERVSELRSVERVDTPTGRYQDGAFTAIDGLIGPPSSVELDDEAPRYALVVPGVTGRSAGAIALVEAVEATNAPVDAELGGVPVAARDAESQDRSHVWMTILALAAVGGVAAFVLIGDLGLAGMSFGIRLLGLAAVAGVYQLLVSDASGAELQLALLITAVGSGAFELGYLRRLLAEHRRNDTDTLLEQALDIEGTAAGLALGLGAIAGLGLLLPDLAIARRFGILLAVVILIETVIGLWLLRPAVLGTRAIRYFASGPVRVALQSLSGSSVTSPAEHRAWVDVVSGLLFDEFAFQADPSMADVDTVFVAGTAIHRKSVDHHVNLSAAGLRIVGRQPQLRALRVVNNSAPATVVVTVDHPVRQLIDQADKVVGVRKAERRSVMLWLVLQGDGSYRIVDSVELGTSSLGVVEERVPVANVTPVAVE